ncbi:hypothetical protein VCV18_001415 [Metarhizium anisopliae]
MQLTGHKDVKPANSGAYKVLAKLVQSVVCAGAMELLVLCDCSRGQVAADSTFAFSGDMGPGK